jgi:hypothetical protein
VQYASIRFTGGARLFASDSCAEMINPVESSVGIEIKFVRILFHSPFRLVLARSWLLWRKRNAV